MRTPELVALYRGFESELLVPLWTEIGDLMPAHPRSRAVPHLWRWSNLLRLAERSGELVPVGRGGERRAIALANPGLGGRPFATPTLWAAIQYLNPRECAPVHRHIPHAFRFVVEGEGVWTVVNGDPVAMRRGDFLPQAGWNSHGHQNVSDRPMAWIDGLDIPFAHYTGSTFFEFGPPTRSMTPPPRTGPAPSFSGHTGLRPLPRLEPTPATPLLAYRWEHTTGPSPSSSLSRPRETRSPWSRATPRSVTSTRPRGETSCPPCPRTSAAFVQAPVLPRAARSGRRSSRSSTAAGGSPSASTAGRTSVATSSSCHRGSPSPSRPSR